MTGRGRGSGWVGDQEEQGTWRRPRTRRSWGPGGAGGCWLVYRSDVGRSDDGRRLPRDQRVAH